MKKINKILVPYELTGVSESALEFAINFCKSDYDKEIHVLHNLSDGAQDATKEIATSVENISKKLPSFRGKIEIIFSQGVLNQEILSAQKKKDIDLIVMGTNNQGKFSHEDGSNTSSLVLEADCPVAVIPNVQKDFKLKKIGLVIDRREIEDQNTLNLLLAIAQRFDSKVQVLTIFSDEKEFEKDYDDEKIEDVLEYNLGSFYESHAFRKSDDLLEAILGFAKEKDIDLLTILPRNHSVKGTPSEGRLTKLLTLKTDIPLLTID